MQYIINESHDGFCDLIDNISTQKQYDMIYVSIGGKMNESDILFSYPHSINKKFPVNSDCQIIPNFIRNRKLSTLVVLIDSFKPTKNSNGTKSHLNPSGSLTGEDLKWDILNPHRFKDELMYKNYQLIQQILQQQETPNMDVLIYDKMCSISDLTEIIEKIVEVCITLNIDETKVMICNYIKFAHPTPSEYEFEKQLPNHIYSVLTKTQNIKYVTCFYQWFGQHIFLYNIVYNYHKYNSYMYMNYDCLNLLFEHALINDHLKETNIFTIMLTLDMQTEKKLRLFLKNSVDIKSYVEMYYNKISFNLGRFL